jgi:hypothetical protein
MSNSEIKSFEELKKQSQQKNNLKYSTYGQFLTLIMKKISNISTVLNQDHMVYQVPEVIIGYPFYDLDDCCNWLKNEILKKGASEVTILEKNILFIKWDLH